jgi:hypothetical protein
MLLYSEWSLSSKTRRKVQEAFMAMSMAQRSEENNVKVWNCSETRLNSSIILDWKPIKPTSGNGKRRSSL